jgi:hypothetical protein
VGLASRGRGQPHAIRLKGLDNRVTNLEEVVPISLRTSTLAAALGAGADQTDLFVVGGPAAPIDSGKVAVRIIEGLDEAAAHDGWRKNGDVASDVSLSIIERLGASMVGIVNGAV